MQRITTPRAIYKRCPKLSTAHRTKTTAMGNGAERIGFLRLQLLLCGVFLNFHLASTNVVTTASSVEHLVAELRTPLQEQDNLDDDLDGRNAYINNQFVPSEPVDIIDEQNTPLYEILQKQMEQVLASSGPDVPLYEDDKSKRPPKKPLFISSNSADSDEDYVEESVPDSMQSYTDAEKPDAAESALSAVEDLSGYQAPQLTISGDKPTNSVTATSPSSTSTTIRNRPHRRRTTTALPKTTRPRTSSQSKQPESSTGSINASNLSTTPVPDNFSSQKPKPPSKPNSNQPQIYQHKRRIVFKTISTGSQFVNSPIGDLLIKFSIGYAKPAQGVAAVSTEAMRNLSNNLMRNLELQKLKKTVKVQKD